MGKKCKPTVLKSGRILLPLYSDTFSVSLMAMSDDQGASWFAGRPLAGYGNIQPGSMLKRCAMPYCTSTANWIYAWEVLPRSSSS